MGGRTATDQPDWTTGPAKWAAVGLLAIASMLGMAWSVRQRSHAPPPAVSRVEPAPSVAPTPFVREADAASAAGGPGEGALTGGGAEPLGGEPALRASGAGGRKINLNTATAAELELLPGIGPTAARRIIEHRVSSGPFRHIEDLDRVKGIGPRTLDKLRELVTVD